MICLGVFLFLLILLAIQYAFWICGLVSVISFEYIYIFPSCASLSPTSSFGIPITHVSYSFWNFPTIFGCSGTSIALTSGFPSLPASVGPFFSNHCPRPWVAAGWGELQELSHLSCRHMANSVPPLFPQPRPHRSLCPLPAWPRRRQTGAEGMPGLKSGNLASSPPCVNVGTPLDLSEPYTPEL